VNDTSKIQKVVFTFVIMLFRKTGIHLSSIKVFTLHNFLENNAKIDFDKVIGTFLFNVQKNNLDL